MANNITTLEKIKPAILTIIPISSLPIFILECIIKSKEQLLYPFNCNSEVLGRPFVGFAIPTLHFN